MCMRMGIGVECYEMSMTRESLTPGFKPRIVPSNGGEAAFPKPPAEDSHMARAGLGFLRQEGATEHRLRSKSLKEIPAYQPALHAVRWAVTCKVEFPACPARELFEDRILRLIVEEIRRGGNAFASPPLFGVMRKENHLLDLKKYLVAHEEPKGPEDDDEPGE